MRLRALNVLLLAAALAANPAAHALQPAPVAVTPVDANSPVEFKQIPDARSKTNEILARHEFFHVKKNSFFDEWIARVKGWIFKLFSHASVPSVPWLAPLIEWGMLIGVACALLLWMWRLNKQQRLAIVEAHGAPTAVWQKESDNWAERARTEAARGEWREAVHCLYWSAIVLLEGQRMWRQNRARTPREYVALLEAGSEKRKALGGLTRVFERIWYGLRPAAESDYQQASAMLDQLRAR